MACILAASGVICLMLALLVGKNSSDFLRAAVRTSGKIIAVIKKESDDGPRYYPVIVFQDRQGAEHRIESPSGDNFSPYVVGEPVSLLYNADNPGNVRSDSFFSLWGYAILPAIVGLANLLGGVAVWLRPTRTPSEFKSRREFQA
jgi:hypothetical protein